MSMRDSVGIAVVVGALLLSALQVTAQEDARPPRMSVGNGSEQKQELDRLHEKLRRISGDAQKDRESQLDRLQELRTEEKSLKRTIDFLEAEVEKRKKALEDKKNKIAEKKRKQEQLQTERSAHVAPLIAHLDVLSAAIEAGIPWHLSKRLGEVEDTQRLIQQKDTPASAALAAVARLQKEQEALGRLVETGTFKVQVESKQIAVQAFHLGLLAVIFASETGDVLGYCSPGQKLEDGIQRVKQSPEAADGYMKAVEILRRKRTPSLVNLHLPSLPLEKGGD